MIECPTVVKSEIRTHYDLATPFYWLLWGPHIHHGLWHGNESPAVAQHQLIEAMIARAALKPGERVVDVGCGMGGSTVEMARHGCDVTGVTLSGVQRLWATCRAKMCGAGERTRFIRADAEKLELPAQSVDVVWSIECTEHLFDKGAFFRKAATWLRPGGRFAICAWLAGEEPLSAELRKQVFDVCEGFLCPSLATSSDYLGWFADAGLKDLQFVDWTAQVDRTWEICRQRVQRFGLPTLVGPINRNMRLFLDRFDAILTAYRSGAMRYGCLTGRLSAS